jgi:hypothetical protein
MVKEAIKSEEQLHNNVSDDVENKEIIYWYNNTSKKEFNDWLKKDVKILAEAVARNVLKKDNNCVFPISEQPKICELNDDIIGENDDKIYKNYDFETTDIKKQVKNKVVMLLMSHLKDTFTPFIKKGEFSHILWNSQ